MQKAPVRSNARELPVGTAIITIHFRRKEMTDPVVAHYSGGASLVDVIAENLRSAGKELAALRTSDLVRFDEFHIRGRKATLELAQQMNWN